jgi:predicted choloylglycine hydrolase
MHLQEFKGSPAGIGQDYGKTFTEQIRKNIDILVKRTGYEPLPVSNPDFIKWVDDQEGVIADNWPWLIEEIHGVAEGAKVEYRDILMLNLRVWQYPLYSGSASTACSSIAIKLSDGTIANAGALDDNKDLYCDMVKIVPENGYGYVTFPITGTSWGNRGLNSAGLCVGASSQILPGMSRLPGTICADIANRVILQTCATVDDVRKFCKKFPFTLNLLCSDKDGDVFSAHCTSAGMFELRSKILTNHVIDDCIRLKLQKQGVCEFRESETTRLRRGRLLDYAEKFSGKCRADDVRKYVADRMAGASCSICPPGNIVLTYANPQAEPGVIWIAEPQAVNHENWERYELFK